MHSQCVHCGLLRNDDICNVGSYTFGQRFPCASLFGDCRLRTLRLPVLFHAGRRAAWRSYPSQGVVFGAAGEYFSTLCARTACFCRGFSLPTANT